MTSQDKRSGDAAKRRARAEAIAREMAAQWPEAIEGLSPEGVREKLHELRVHQIELDMQNEELRLAQIALESSRARCFDLYDLAPVGFCTLSEKGLIQETNLTVANLLGLARGELVRQPLSRFIHRDSQEVYYMHRNRLGETGQPQAFDVQMVKKDEALFWAHLTATAAREPGGAFTSRIVIADITDRKLREDARAMTALLIGKINAPGDLRELMKELVTLLQNWSGCEAVGIRLRQGEDYPYYETRGFPHIFVELEKHLCAHGRDGNMLRDGIGNPVLECMCGNILCGRFDPAKPFFTAHGSFWTNSTKALLASTTEADRKGRTRKRCHGMGYESVALVPLRTGLQTFGLLQFNDRRPNRFNPDLIDSFETMADSLAMALSQRQAADAVLAGKAMLDAALASITDAVFISDAQGRVVEFNDAFATFHKFKNKAEMARTLTEYPRILEVFKADGEPAPLEQWAVSRALRGETSKSVEYTLRRKDTGETWEGSYSFAPIRDQDGAITGSVVIGRDITELKRAEAERNRLFKAVEQAGELIAITSPEGLIQYTNPSFETITGYSSREVAGKTPRFLKSGLHDHSFYKHLWDTILSGKRWTGKLVNRRKDGSTYTSECAISPVKDANGGILNFIWIAKDITKELELEKRISQSQRMESIGTLAGGIAHDFNNILYPIIGMSEMLLEDLAPENSAYENVQVILEAGKRGGELVKQILAFSRQNEEKMIPVRVQQVLKEVLKLCRSTIPTDIKITQSIANDCGLILADATQLHQIAMNLITNAYHAVEPISGTISVQLKSMELTPDDAENRSLKPGHYAMLSVSDTGCGIQPDLIGKIFEPYFTTKGKGKGTGLGLAVVYGIIQKYNGEIKVFSEVGKGTTFDIYFPLMEKPTETRPDQTAETLPSGTERILVVDDEASIARLEKQILARHGYQVTVSFGSTEALEAFRANPTAFDLLITDMTMPNMTGDQLAKEILKIRPDIPVIICTGFSDRMNQEKAERIGIKGFLMKPVVQSEMLKTIRKVLDETKAHIEP